MKALPIAPTNAPLAIGARIRAARQARRLTIEQVAESTGLTKGFLSRVERNLTSPSVSSLATLCQALSIGIGDLFRDPETNLTRWDEAPTISLGGGEAEERLLTSCTERRFQMVRSVIAPGVAGVGGVYAVDCETEVLHVASGSFELLLDGRSIQLAEGDTVTFPGREPHSWRNPADTEAVVLWALISPGAGASTP